MFLTSESYDLQALIQANLKFSKVRMFQLVML